MRTNPRRLILFLSLILSSYAFADFDFFLIRGLTRESGHWGTQFEKSLKEVYPNSTVTYMDLPGAGEFVSDRASANMTELMEFTREKYKEKMDNSDHTRVVVATSLAGMLMLEWAANYPGEFDGLVLSASGVKKVCKGNDRIKLSSYPKTIGIGLSLNKKRKEARILKINSNDKENFEKNLQDWIEIQEQRPMTFGNVFRQTMAALNYKPNLAIPEIPMLVLGSEGDKLVKVKCIEDVANYYGADMAIHPSAGHGIPIDAPEWMVENIEDWINKVYPN